LFYIRGSSKLFAKSLALGVDWGLLRKDGDRSVRFIARDVRY
jgi:hypothetical protein